MVRGGLPGGLCGSLVCVPKSFLRRGGWHPAGRVPPGWALSPGACIGQELKGRGRWRLRIKAARAPQMPGSQAGPGPFIGLAGLQATGLLSGWCQGAHFSSAGKPEGWFDSRSPARSVQSGVQFCALSLASRWPGLRCPP